MSIQPYKKSREEWKNDESGNTPVTAENLNHIEDGIYNNSVNIKELFDKIQDLESKMQLS